MNDELRRFVGDYDNSYVVFDAVWNEVQQEILDKLAATTDVEACARKSLTSPRQ